MRQLQLSEEQQQEMLAVRKTWREFLAGYDVGLIPHRHVTHVNLAVLLVNIAEYCSVLDMASFLVMRYDCLTL